MFALPSKPDVKLISVFMFAIGRKLSEREEIICPNSRSAKTAGTRFPRGRMPVRVAAHVLYNVGKKYEHRIYWDA